jgi:hypothetical protein
LNTRADSPLSRLVNDEVVLPEVDEVVTEVTVESDPPEEPPEVVEVATLPDKPLSPSTTTRLSPLWEPKCITSLYAKMRNLNLGF